jgi:predicted RNA binding protein YcfA (HicA-like mRNA interferase family)
VALPRSTPRRTLIKKFRNLGFEGPVSGGRHAFMKRGALKVRIPNQDIQDAGLLREILRQADITADEYLEA